MQRDAKLPTELVNAFSTFRNSPAPFSIQCGREQNGTENRKLKKGEKKAKTKRTENREWKKGGGAAVESAWIIYWELRHCLCFNLLLFVYVAIEKYWTEILQYDLWRECEG